MQQVVQEVVPLAALVGVPLYLNELGALPIVSGLLNEGMQPGAVIAFLIAGGVTSVPAMAAVWAITRPRVYRGEESGDAPVVICSELSAEPGAEAANITLMAGHLAAEVIREHFPGGLPDLPRPLLWIEQRLTFEGDPQEYSLVSFPFYRPRPAGLGSDERATLGTPRREQIGAEEVASLVS